ncbi:MAG: SRPBCC family protein [Gammaproteobacteria bacterium]
MPATNQSIVINAPIDNIWARFNDFHDMSWAPNVITGVEKVGDIDGTQIGAQRILNDAFHETLREVDAANHTIKYSIDDGPSPVSKDEVSNYIGTIKLSDADDGTLVEWTSDWDSNAEDAVEFCHGIYVALLGDLKATFN